jgi:hypothetical protein
MATFINSPYPKIFTTKIIFDKSWKIIWAKMLSRDPDEMIALQPFFPYSQFEGEISKRKGAVIY